MAGQMEVTYFDFSIEIRYRYFRGGSFEDWVGMIAGYFQNKTPSFICITTICPKGLGRVTLTYVRVIRAIRTKNNK